MIDKVMSGELVLQEVARVPDLSALKVKVRTQILLGCPKYK